MCPMPVEAVNPETERNAIAGLKGLIAIAVAWVAYLGLRVLGRRHQHRPDLGQHIRTAEEQGRGDADYYI